MRARDRILYRSVRGSARLLSPLVGFAEVQAGTELRLDPLTGRAAVIGLALGGKRAVLIAETDGALLERIGAATRPSCFFCPERVEQATPRYPEDVLPGGRLRRGSAILFPNLFPLTEVHAVVALGTDHCIALDRFTPELLVDGLGAAVSFIRTVVPRIEPRVPHWSVCANYLPPGGASLVHPHFQILGSAAPLTTPSVESEAARAYLARHGHCYFEDLVEVERCLETRFLGTTGPVSWLVPFAPRGTNEVIGVCSGASDVTQLDDGHVHALGQTLSKILGFYNSQKLSTFNLSIYSAPIGMDHDSFRVYASIVSRQSVVENYRCDDYFLQKMLGTEVVVDPPESLASLVRDAIAGVR